MEQQSLAPNETMQIHEMLNFKTVCMTTSKMMEGVVFDNILI
jgi:similar to spore coat protein